MKKENEIQEERTSNYLHCQKWNGVEQVILSVGSIFQLRYSGVEMLRWRVQLPNPSINLNPEKADEWNSTGERTGYVV